MLNIIILSYKHTFTTTLLAILFQVIFGSKDLGIDRLQVSLASRITTPATSPTSPFVLSSRTRAQARAQPR